MDTLNTFEQVQQQYPEMHEHMQAMPRHLTDQIGEAALQLSHLDMHPMTTVQMDNGNSYENIDFSQRITDPNYDTAHLDAGAIEAAEAGKETLAGLLGSGAFFLRAAHEKLEQEGITFAAPNEDEPADQQQLRQQSERAMVFERAKETAILAASDAKLMGHAEESVKATEALILLQFLDPKDAPRVYREAVVSGLGDELLAAAPTAETIVAGSEYNTLSKTLAVQRDLLQLATGKSFDFSFKNIKDLTTPDLENMRLNSFDHLRSILAVAAAPRSTLSRETLAQLVPNYDFQKVLRAKMGSNAAPDQLLALYQGAELLGEDNPGDSFEKALKYEDPTTLGRAAEKLGQRVYMTDQIVGRTVEGSDVRSFNSERLNGLSAIKAKYPDKFDIICQKLSNELYFRDSELHDTLDPTAMLEAMTVLEDAGLGNNLAMLEDVASRNDPVELAGAAKLLSEHMRSNGLDPESVDELAKNTHYKNVLALIQSATVEGKDASSEIDRAIIESQITTAYATVYDHLTYPVSLDAIRNPDLAPKLEVFPLIGERMGKLGLSQELSAKIFKAWGTFNAFQDVFDDELPNQKPAQEFLHDLAIEQSEAMMKQLKAIENFSEAYGQAVLHQVIQRFGIHNFSRYDAKRLADQNYRWGDGQAVKTVVASGRYTWNSVADKSPRFEEGQGDGVFEFEMSTPKELAEIAIQVGAYERAQDREPDVRRFIVHAHGNPDLMVLGPNREKLTTALYRQAAEKRTKLPKAEINDYKRHLGPDYEIILQSCSTAGKNGVQKNIAETMNEGHDARIKGLDASITSLTIKSDGTIKFGADASESDGSPVTYDN